MPPQLHEATQAMPHATPAAALDVRLLGDFSAEHGGVPLPALRTGRIQSLLTLLLLRRGVPQQRKALAFLFWPETTDAQAQTNLRTVVHRLRNALPDADRLLRVDRNSVLWLPDAPCRLDVAAFEAGTAEGAPLPALIAALELYRGELLPGCYDDWIVPDRERLAGRFRRACADACARLEEAREYAAALAVARRAARAQPLDEEWARRLMRLHALAGDRAAALRAYAACEAALAAELGVEPEAETRAVRDRLADGEAVPVLTGGGAATDLVGRRDEWLALQHAWERALAGPSRLVLLTGEAGIGKTRLAEEFAARLARQGFTAAIGRAYEAEAGFAYAPILPWLRAGLDQAAQRVDDVWLAEAARLVPELRAARPGLPTPSPISDPGQRERFAGALVRVALAHGRPALFVLDDLHWCAGETAGWIHHLLNFAEGPPRLVVATMRDAGDDDDAPEGATRALLGALERGGRLDRVVLRGLGEDESATLAGAVAAAAALPAPEPDSYRPALGNPLFITESIRFHAEASGTAEAAALPPTVLAIMRARLARLSPAARDVARCVAVIGRPAAAGLIAAVADLQGPQLVGPLDELCRRRILSEGAGQAFDFPHPLLRDTAYTEMTPVLRRHRHGTAAAALSAGLAGGEVVHAEAATHYERAGLIEQALASHLAAAETAHRVGALDKAISTLRHACTLAETDPGLARYLPDARAKLAELLRVTGRYVEARDICLRALASVDEPVRRARFHRELAKARTGEGQPGAALEALAEAERLLDGLPTDDAAAAGERLQLGLDRCGVLYWTGDWHAMEEVHRTVLSHLERYGSARQRAQHAWSITAMRLRRDRYAVSDELVSLVRDALRAVSESGDVPAEGVARFRLAFLLLWHGSTGEAAAEAAAALRVAERIGDRSLELRCLTYLAVIARRMGVLPAVRSYAERALAKALDQGQREYTGAARANLGWLLGVEGDRAGALAHLHGALDQWSDANGSSPGFMFEGLARWPLLAMLLDGCQSGVDDTAFEHARRLLRPSQQRPPAPVETLLEAALRLRHEGDDAAAAARLAEAVALAREHRHL
jgi:DNA-binding SARP family transcriptional activator/tetratricopeptide (TPR) repeat protein